MFSRFFSVIMYYTIFNIFVRVVCVRERDGDDSQEEGALTGRVWPLCGAYDRVLSIAHRDRRDDARCHQGARTTFRTAAPLTLCFVMKRERGSACPTTPGDYTAGVAVLIVSGSTPRQ